MKITRITNTSMVGKLRIQDNNILKLSILAHLKNSTNEAGCSIPLKSIKTPSSIYKEKRLTKAFKQVQKDK